MKSELDSSDRNAINLRYVQEVEETDFSDKLNLEASKFSVLDCGWKTPFTKR